MCPPQFRRLTELRGWTTSPPIGLTPMELRSPAGDTLQITIGGYQFPDAHDPAQRYSWHMVQGTASSNGTTWNFHWPALTCDEWALLSIWLRRVARLLSHPPDATAEWPPPLQFNEPNLRLALTTATSSSATIRAGLDYEFQPPGTNFGTPYNLDLTVTKRDLLQAADDWDAARWAV